MKKKIFWLILVAAIVLLVICALRSNEKLETAAVKTQFKEYPEPKMEIRINNIIDFERVDVLWEMLLPEQWEKVRYPDEEKLLFRVRLNEGYEIYVYSTYVRVHDEYGLPFKKRQEDYALSAEAVGRIAEYLK